MTLQQVRCSHCACCKNKTGGYKKHRDRDQDTNKVRRWRSNEGHNNGDLQRECRLGWHTGLARVGEVQPGPIPVKPVPVPAKPVPVPAKPVPVRVRVQTRTASPAGFCKHRGYL